MFIEPGHPNYSLHYCTVSGKILVIQLDAFVREVLDGCSLWLKEVEGKEPFNTNYCSFAAVVTPTESPHTSSGHRWSGNMFGGRRDT